MFWDNWFKKKKEVVEVELDSASIKSILIDAGCSVFKIDILDRKFILPVDAQVEDIVWGSGVRNKNYVPGKFECEEFSYLQLAHFLGKGYAFGCAHIFVDGMKTSHMVNIYINNRKEVVFIEPQTGFKFTKKITKLYRVVIV